MELNLALVLQRWLAMWTSIVIRIVLLLSIGSTSVNVKAGEVFGRYTGTLRLEKRGLQQLAKLDFISLRDASNKLKLMAVLSLYFGGFDSDEYISYHYDEVELNLLSGTLVFSQGDQDLTIETVVFQKESIVASVRSATGGNIGTLNLTVDNSGHLGKSNFVTPLAGEYSGVCDGRQSYLNIQTYRSTSDTVRIGNPFGAYKVNGQFGATIFDLCRSSKPCVVNQITDGSFNFFSGQLTLHGSKKTEQCNVDRQGNIQCGSCKYRKHPIEIINTKVWPFAKPFDSISKYQTESPAYLKKGVFQGYLFHERRKIYQRMALNILSYQKGRGNQYTISSVANLFFGDFNSSEILTYRFHDKPVNLLDNTFVLERTNSDVDAILKITSIGKNYLKGIWYSILFGRVGEFYVAKNSAPEIISKYPFMNTISGNFNSPNFKLDLDTFLGQTPVNTENPFFPLMLSGFFSYRSGIASRIMISGGSYDFYTGKIGIEIDGGKRFSSGSISNQNEGMYLRWTSNGFSTILQHFKPRFFRLIE